MKRFFVFAYPAYYPGGGWCDFKKSFDDEQEAIAYADKIASDNIEVIDLETEEDIYIYPDKR
jgi:hypothetical protein